MRAVSVFGSDRRTWRACIFAAGLVLGVGPAPARAQEAQLPSVAPVEAPPAPTVGSAVSTGATVAQPPGAEAIPSGGSSIMGNVRAAAERMLETSPEALRRRTLDTSFPAEQPALEVPEPPREVIAAPPAALAPPQDESDVARGPSRRTVLRTIDGVTVLTNVTDEVGDEAQKLSPNTGRPPAAEPPSRAAAANAGVALERDVSANVNALNPESKAPSTTGSGVWLWILTGFALVLLVPIAVLLMRPVRKG